MNSGNPLGVGWLQSTINHGKRDSSATAYLAQDVLDRPNLDVVVGTQVTRVLKTDSVKGRPIFGAVEIILSLGVIGTPHVLLNSGIGDASELRALGIEPVLDLPDVGKNFSDQPAVWNTWRVDSANTMDDLQRNPMLREQFMREWEVNKTGMLVLPIATHLIYGRLPTDSPIFQISPDPSSGTNAPHWEIFTVVRTPSQCGTVALKSSNPLDDPLIDPGTLGTEFDVFTLREAFKASARFLSANAWNDYVVESVGGLQKGSSDEHLDQYIRQSAVVALHGVGTTGMSAFDASYGVVNPDLRVKGASGLRIVDASVLVSISLSSFRLRSDTVVFSPIYLLLTLKHQFISSRKERPI
ncbi:hypothetical protein C0991_010126 [Blastosporella zonata]|nr:hypothetical protein C0991_010126 [Blastosporella zonata]